MKNLYLPASIWLITSFSFIFTTKAQLHPPNEEHLTVRAKAEYSLLVDLKNAEKYEEAAPHLHWLLKHNPEIHRSIYIYGTQVLDAIIQLETSPERTIMLKDSSMLVHDMRIKFFGDEANVLNRKMEKAYRYYNNDPDQYDWMLSSYAKVYQLNRSVDILNTNTIGYFEIIHRHYKHGGNLSPAEVLDIFYQVVETIDQKLALKKHESLLKIYKNRIITVLGEIINIDCAFIASQLGEKILADPADIMMSEILISYSKKYDCEISPNILLAMENVFNEKPSFEVAWEIAKGKVTYNLLNEALKYYELAIDNTDDYSTKAILKSKIGHIFAKQNNLVMARASYLEALNYDPTYKKAYGFIGDLYFNSYENCKKRKNQLEDRAIYIAAYEKYELAENHAAMKRCLPQFPSASEIHGNLAKVGDNYKAGCWVNEVVKLRKRPAEF